MSVIVNTELPPELIIKHKKEVKAGIISNNRRQSPGVILGEVRTYEHTDYPVMGCILGNFEQGPLEANICDTEDEFYHKYGLMNTKDSISALSYLHYAPNLLVKRVIGINSTNAFDVGNTLNSEYVYAPIKVLHLEDIELPGFLNENTFIRVITQHPGAFGNKISVAMFTQKESLANKDITPYYKARDITESVPYLNYCVAVFFDNRIVEVFTVPINELETVNTLSKYIYVKTTINVQTLGVYDGNADIFNGNIGLFRGESDLYEGFFGYFDGNICFIDGNVSKPLFCVPTFYAETLLNLDHGYTEPPTDADYDDAVEEIENKNNYDVDLNIANNAILERDDIINIIPTPNTVNGAIDFSDNLDTEFYGKDVENTGIMLIFGEKKVDTIILGLAGDYAGQRAITMVNDGIEVSNSKISKRLAIDKLIYTPKFEEQEKLYSNGVNPVVDDNGIIYCNGEKLYRNYNVL